MRGNLRVCRRLLAAVVCQLIVFQAAASAQSPIGLRIVVLQGDGNQNVVNQIPPEPIAVRIVDRNDRRIAGAKVTFLVPESGPAGTFANGSSVLQTVSDDFGRAVAPFFRANALEGSYQIQVRAEYKDETVMATVRQSNVLTAKKSFPTKVLVILAVAAGAAGAAFAAKGGSDSGSNPGPAGPVPTITFSGNPNVGPPR